MKTNDRTKERHESIISECFPTNEGHFTTVCLLYTTKSYKLYINPWSEERRQPNGQAIGKSPSHTLSRITHKRSLCRRQQLYLFPPLPSLFKKSNHSFVKIYFKQRQLVSISFRVEILSYFWRSKCQNRPFIYSDGGFFSPGEQMIVCKYIKVFKSFD